MKMCDYKDLNLDREALDANIQSFVASRGFSIDGGINGSPARKRVVFGAPGSEFATVDMHLNKTGTTTLQWKMGKNQAVGEQLAVYLKATINPAELENVNYSLQGITSDSIDAIIALFEEDSDIEVEVIRDEVACKLVRLKSAAHQDTLAITHHRRTRVLQIQGKPLSCYRRVIFMLTDLLDLKGLEQVLYRKDDSSAEIVRKEVAEDYLKGFFPNTYDHLPKKIRSLLISSCCVKLAAPDLPDYCLLLYPDLRSLEGALKEVMAEHKLSVQDYEKGFGEFFDVNKNACNLKLEYAKTVPDHRVAGAINAGYSFFRKHRNAIFHMEEFPDGSRVIANLSTAIDLSKEAYAAIDSLYSAMVQK